MLSYIQRLENTELWADTRKYRTVIRVYKIENYSQILYNTEL